MVAVSMVAKKTAEKMAERGYWVDSWTLEFADDSSGVIVADREEILQDAVNIMSSLFEEFFNSIGMALNASGQVESKVVKLLGLWIDNNYKFETHTQKVLQKVRFKLANLSLKM